MNLNDWVARVEFHDELVRRMGHVPGPGKRPRLDDVLKGAYTVLETAMQLSRPEAAAMLIRATAQAHQKYSAPGSLKSAGFLHFLFEALAQELQLEPSNLPTNLKWACRLMETLCVTLGDAAFATFIRDIDETVELLDSDPELAGSPA